MRATRCPRFVRGRLAGDRRSDHAGERETPLPPVSIPLDGGSLRNALFRSMNNPFASLCRVARMAASYIGTRSPAWRPPTGIGGVARMAASHRDWRVARMAASYIGCQFAVAASM